MRTGKAVTIYLDEAALTALDQAVDRRARLDRENGLGGYSVTNRSKLVSEIVSTYLMEDKGDNETPHQNILGNQ